MSARDDAGRFIESHHTIVPVDPVSFAAGPGWIAETGIHHVADELERVAASTVALTPREAAGLAAILRAELARLRARLTARPTEETAG